MITEEFDFTEEQAIAITRILWPRVHEPFILGFAETLHEKGYSWFTNECIDLDEAYEIVIYLKL